MRLSAVSRKSISDLTRRRARAVFAVATLALAVASVGLFALPTLMSRAMDRRDRRQPARRRDDHGQAAAADRGAASGASDACRTSLRSSRGRTFSTRVYVGARREKAFLDRRAVLRVTRRSTSSRLPAA